MPNELPKQYDPHAAQERWLKFWNERGYFHSDPPPANAGGSPRTPFTIVIPPPNVTGALHMGHALNNTLQDVLIRWRRMQGYNALYLPGTDHAGIATQAVVEKRIAQEEKKTRHQLGRDELVKRIWQWKDQYEKRILTQLRQLGTSCDWRRTRFTLDEMCSRAVRQTFFDFFKKGLIFRGKRLVNWDAQLQTSVADDETYTEDTKSGFWTFKYPVQGEPGASALGGTEFIRFSTTRPETMLGDTAVCVHPGDERYKHLIGKKVLQPLTGREIPIIADGLLADPALGTGCVKVTPGHDPNDYACWQRHPAIGIINILNPDGTINENGGKYRGMDRYKAREPVVKAMEELGLYEGCEDRVIPLKYSDRSKTPIEPYLSDQWFVRMGDGPNGEPGLAQMAMDAVTSRRVKIHPERYARTYLDWLGEKRDWCISRQLWWGHRIPVWRWSPPASKQVPQESFDLISRLAVTLPNQYPDDVVGGMSYRLVPKTPGEPHQGRILREYVGQGEHALAEREEQYLEGSAQLCLRKDMPDVIREIEDAGFTQDPDVLDTWFSSALWPFATLGWPEETPELNYYYPTNVLVTSRGIITLWVARMVIAGLMERNEVPFHDVYITTTILDAFGETMSKSKGNGVDPLDILERYGTDALRFQMAYLSTDTQDNKLPVSNACPHCDVLMPVKQEHMYMRTRKVTCPSCKKPFRPGGPWPSEDAELKTAKQASESFEQGRNFANKLWNAARFVLMNLDGYMPGALGENLPIEDRWILSRLATTTAAVTQQLEAFRFSEAVRTLYDFTWSEFCDWYVETAKSRLKSDAEIRGHGDAETDDRRVAVSPRPRVLVQRMLAGVLDAILKLLHPVMPFVTESLWQALNEAAFERGLPNPEPAAESVMIAPWPDLPSAWRDAAIEQRIGRMQELVRAVRNIRNQFNVNEKASVDVSVLCGAAVGSDFEQLAPFIVPLAKVGRFDCGPMVAKPPQSAAFVHPEFEAYVHLQGLIDVAAEVKRLDKQRGEKERQLTGVRSKLSNASFVERAPVEVVQQQKQLEVELANQIKAIDENLQQLKPAS